MFSLRSKVAVVFAATGAIGREVSRSFAEAGARVYVSGRKMEALQTLVNEIRNEGGEAFPFRADARNEESIDSFLKFVQEKEGGFHIVFNAIGRRPEELKYGTSGNQLPFSTFMETLDVNVGSQFLTSRMAAKYMMSGKTEGTILTLSASLSRIKAPLMPAISAACSAIEGLTRSLAAEYGSAGIRVICMNPTSLKETRTIKETTALISKTMGIPAEAFEAESMKGYLMGKSPNTADVGKLAAFLVSDTGALLNSHVIDADFGTHSVI